MEWNRVEDMLPEINHNLLVMAKKGNYWAEVHGPIDERPVSMYVGFFYDCNETFKNLKPCIKFQVDCGCSGYEHDRADLEILYWMPLPEAPK
jgi:hypothetical protein